MRRVLLAGAALATLAGCGPKASGGNVTVTFTRDFGAHADGSVVHRTARPGATLATLTRRAGRPTGSVYLNGTGVGRDLGVKVHAGDRVLVDRHDTTAAPVLRAIVGQFPEPFLHGIGGRRPPFRLECASGSADACDVAADRLSAAGLSVNRAVLGAPAGKDTTRVLLGPWDALRGDAAAAQIARGPAVSGVYARPADGGAALDVLGATGELETRLTAGTGLVAATAYPGQLPTWIVTGTDAAGLRAAAGALSETDLAGRFAAIVRGGRVSSAPESGARP